MVPQQANEVYFIHRKIIANILFQNAVYIYQLLLIKSRLVICLYLVFFSEVHQIAQSLYLCIVDTCKHIIAYRLHIILHYFFSAGQLLQSLNGWLKWPKGLRITNLVQKKNVYMAKVRQQESIQLTPIMLLSPTLWR